MGRASTSCGDCVGAVTCHIAMNVAVAGAPGSSSSGSSTRRPMGWELRIESPFPYSTHPRLTTSCTVSEGYIVILTEAARHLICFLFFSISRWSFRCCMCVSCEVRHEFLSPFSLQLSHERECGDFLSFMEWVKGSVSGSLSIVLSHIFVNSSRVACVELCLFVGVERASLFVFCELCGAICFCHGL